MPDVNRPPPDRQHVSSVIFDADKYSKAESRRWLEKHDYHTDGYEKRGSEHWWKQRNNNTEKFRYRRKNIDDGIDLLIAYPKNQEKSAMTEELKRLLEQMYGVDTRGLTDEQIRQTVEQERAAGTERRAVGIEPSTIDRDNRTVETVIATDEPTRVIDWTRLEVVDEVLRMDGVQLDDVRRNKLVLLDSHQQDSARRVLGSVINLQVQNNELRGTRVYSEVSQPEFVKTAEGHLDAGSVGYRVTSAAYVEPGETETVEGVEYTAGSRTLKVATSWVPGEESIVAIGADPQAGTRSDSSDTTPTTHKRGTGTMDKHLRKLCEQMGLRKEADDAEAQKFVDALPEGVRNGLTAQAEQARKAADGSGTGNGTGTGATGGPSGGGGSEPSAGTGGDTNHRSVPDSGVSGSGQDSQREPAATGGGAASGGDTTQRGGQDTGSGLSVEQERQRVKTIRHEVFGTAVNIDDSYRSLMDHAIEDGYTVDQARAALLSKMQQDTPPVGNARVTQDESEKRRAGMQDALLARAAPQAAAEFTQEQTERANEFRGMSLFDMCRDTLIRGGIDERELRSQRKIDVVGGAFSGMLNGRAITHATGDFSNILANTARKVLLAGFQQSSPTWQKWCGSMPVSDFKSVDIAALSGFTVLDEIPEGGEFPHHSLSDQSESVSADTHGNIFAITRQAIINDDLNAFSRVPMMQGYAAGRTINRLAVVKLLANNNLSDGNALFSSEHNNILTGTDYKPDTLGDAKSALNELKKQMRKQTGIEGETLDLQPEVVLAGPTYEDYLREAVNDTSTVDSSREPNRALRGLDVAIDPELENSNITGNSTTATYLFANPTIAPVVMLAFLDGVQEPYLEQRAGWNVDGTEFKVRIDVGAGLADFRGGQKATGES